MVIKWWKYEEEVSLNGEVMYVKKTRPKRYILFRLSAVLISILLSMYAWEVILSHSSDLPFNGYKDGVRYTWGHPVRYNSLGFREKEIGEKSKFRVMVIGDSYTWGAGLSNEQRYTDLCNTDEIEVLNFGKSGHDFLDYYKTLYKHYDRIKPDVVVIGYCSNDTQVKRTNYSPERELWEVKYKNGITSTKKVFASLGMSEIGGILERSVYKIAERLGVFPHWVDALDRTYQIDSTGWYMTVNSLYRIKKMCSLKGIPVIFFTLNHGIHFGRNTNYNSPGKREMKVLAWWKQTEELAKSLGYEVINVEDRIKLMSAPMGVNKRDIHPSAALNRVYASKLSIFLNRVLYE